MENLSQDDSRPPPSVFSSFVAPVIEVLTAKCGKKKQADKHDLNKSQIRRFSPVCCKKNGYAEQGGYHSFVSYCQKFRRCAFKFF